MSKNVKNVKEAADMTFRQFLLKLRDIYRPFLGVVAALLSVLVLREALGLVSPYIYGKIIDGIIANRAMADVVKLLLISFGVFLVNGILLSYIKEKIEIQKLDFDVASRVAEKTLDKMLGFSIGQHENQNSGIKKSVIDRGEHSLTSLAYTLIYDIFPMTLQIIVVVTALSVIAPLLGFIVFCGVAVFIASTFYANYILRNDLKKMQDMEHKLDKKHSEILRNVSLVKINARESAVIREYGDTRAGINNFAKKVWSKFTIFAHGRALLSQITRFVVILVGIYMVYEKVYTPGFLVVFLYWTSAAFSNLGYLSNIHRRTIEMYTAVKKYFILIDVGPDIKEVKNPASPAKFNGKIEYKNICFRYPKREYISDDKENDEEGGDNDSSKKDEEPKEREYVLKNINITIESGQRVAVVGPSGAGKSTLVHLLIRAYDPDQGNIFIDGFELKNLALENFRSVIGMVSQDISLFDNTLRYNILFGVCGREISEEQLWQGAKMACIDKFIAGLEKGFDTIIGERGVKLSGGERQRVGIARALVKNPSILIFDEATSSLDAENESLIKESIEKASKGRTTIIIAHRLSTIKDADKIIVMEKGQVVGEGKHGDLLETCATYRRLVSHQTVMIGGM